MMCSVLLPELRHRILKLLPPNEVALSGRLTCKDAAEALGDPQHGTVSLRERLPDHADPASCVRYAESSFLKITFRKRLRVTSVAAASGSEANLTVAWGLLKPCLFEELCPGVQSVPLLHYASASWLDGNGLPTGPPLIPEDPGSAAVKAGHVHLLPWLLHNCVPLDPQRTLNAAAEHCDLVGLQAVWDMLASGPPGSSGSPYYKTCSVGCHCCRGRYRTIHAAARSQPPDSAAAKVKWLCEKAGDTEESHLDAAVGAAEAGNTGLFLRWPLHRHLRVLAQADSEYTVLATALQHFSEPEALDWLLDEGGFKLPGEEDAWGLLAVWKGAAASGSVDVLRWLVDKAVALPREQLNDDDDDDCEEEEEEEEEGQGDAGRARALGKLLVAAAKTGQVEPVRFLHEELGVPLTANTFCAAAGSGSIPLAAWLLQAGCPARPAAYTWAAAGAHVGMVRWLAEEARCPFAQETLPFVTYAWAQGSGADASGSHGGSRGGAGGELLDAVKVLLDAGCCLGARDDALQDAAWRGDLPLVRYLHAERGVALGDGILARAAENGSGAVLEYLWAAGCAPHKTSSSGSGAEVVEPHTVAGSNGDLATLRCLQALGVPWDGRWAVERTLRRSVLMLPVVRWFVEQGAEVATASGVQTLAHAVVQAHRLGTYAATVEWLMLRFADADSEDDERQDKTTV